VKNVVKYVSPPFQRGSNLAANAWHAYYAARQYDRAIQVVQDALKMDPYFASGHYRLSLSWEQKGEYEKAIDEGLLYYRSQGDDPGTFEPRFAALRRAYASGGPQGYWRQRLHDKLEASDPEARFGADGLATIYMNLHEREQALESIENGIRMHNPHTIMWTPIIAVFDPIRSDPRYKKIFGGLGLPVTAPN